MERACSRGEREQGHLRGKHIAIWVHEFVDSSGAMLIGGVQTYVLELARTLSEAGASVTIAHPFTGAANLILDTDVRVVGLSTEEWRGGQLGDRADIHIVANCHAAPRNLSGPTVGVQHGVYWDRPPATARFPGLVGTVVNLARAYRHQRVVTKFDLLVCVDYNFGNSAAALRPPFPWGDTRVIVNFAPSAPPPTFGRPIRRIVFPRRLVPHRGTDLLVSAVTALDSLGWGGAVDIIGAGPEAGLISEALKNRDNVHFRRLATRDRMEAYSSDALVLVPSHSTEGTSLVCLEAWAAGAIVLATPVGGLSNLVVDGLTGFLALPTVTSMSARLAEILRLPTPDLDGIRAVTYAASQGPLGVARWSAAWVAVIRELTSLDQ